MPSCGMGVVEGWCWEVGGMDADLGGLCLGTPSFTISNTHTQQYQYLWPEATVIRTAVSIVWAMALNSDSARDRGRIEQV